MQNLKVCFDTGMGDQVFWVIILRKTWGWNMNRQQWTYILHWVLIGKEETRASLHNSGEGILAKKLQTVHYETVCKDERMPLKYEKVSWSIFLYGVLLTLSVTKYCFFPACCTCFCVHNCLINQVTLLVNYSSTILPQNMLSLLWGNLNLQRNKGPGTL